MTTKWFGARVQRVEDDRLLRGHGRFTDDIDEGALESCIVRSPYAHALIRSIDVSAARGMPGVVAVYTAADLPFGQTDLPILIPHPNLTHGRTQRCLASEVVRYVGEAVAFIVAESRSVAEDAAEPSTSSTTTCRGTSRPRWSRRWGRSRRRWRPRRTAGGTTFALSAPRPVRSRGGRCGLAGQPPSAS